MKCPFCGNEDTRVIDSRPSDDNSTIRRRRQCDKCNKRFTTYEKVETIPLVVIKKDMTRETYDRSKIESGVFRSCHKRPVPVEDITACVEDIENAIFNKGIYILKFPIYRCKPHVSDLIKGFKSLHNYFTYFRA